MIGVGGVFLLNGWESWVFLLIKIECEPNGCKKTNIIIVEQYQKWSVQTNMGQIKKESVETILVTEGVIMLV